MKTTIKRAAAHLRKGGLAAFPTETVYGLGADARNGRAAAAIFEIKDRPRFNPLIVHVESLEKAASIGRLNVDAARLATRFWPGPLTLVVPRREGSGVSDLVSAGLETIALRVPAHPAARALIEAAAAPIAAPSANRSGRLSPTCAAHVEKSLGKEALIVDGGPCALGLESTVIGCLEEGAPSLLRPGALPREEIEAALGAGLGAGLGKGGGAIVSPGQMLSHYAPRARLRLNAKEARQGEALLAFGRTGGAPVMRNLSAEGDLREAAANLFAMLHDLDEEGAEMIAVSPIPEAGLGAAINDRLKKAATPRTPRS